LSGERSGRSRPEISKKLTKNSCIGGKGRDNPKKVTFSGVDGNAKMP